MNRISDIRYFERNNRPRLAYRYSPPSDEGAARAKPIHPIKPVLIFLPGYMSDMTGGKATALFDHCRDIGQACLLFDYSGCGLSGGCFAEQTLTEWRDDTLALIETLLAGPIILIGSSMGGWLMLLVALALEQKRMQAPEQTPQPKEAYVAGLIGIAPAPDFTEWGVDAEDKALIMTEGQIIRDISSFDQPYVMTRGFIESGQSHRLLDKGEDKGEDKGIALTHAVRLLHGLRDETVPYDLSLRLAQKLDSKDVQITFVKDGDHRLSRDADIALLLDTAQTLSHMIAQTQSGESL